MVKVEGVRPNIEEAFAKLRYSRIYDGDKEDTGEEMSYDDTPMAHSAQSADGNKGNQEDGDHDDGKGQRQILGRFLFLVFHRQLFEVSD